MDKLLHDLGLILLRALPTFFLVVLLHFYLKYVFFKPLHKVLKTRYDASEGARKLAEEAIERAGARAADYEAKIRAAKAEIFKEQEQKHRELRRERDEMLAAERRRAEEQIEAARRDLSADVEQAKRALGSESDALAAQIAQSILHRRVA